MDQTTEDLSFDDLEPLEQVMALERLQKDQPEKAKALSRELSIATRLLEKQKYAGRRLRSLIEDGPTSISQLWKERDEDTDYHALAQHLLREVDVEFLVLSFEELNAKKEPRETDGHRQLFIHILANGNTAQLTRIVRYLTHNEDLQVRCMQKILESSGTDELSDLLNTTKDEHDQIYYCENVRNLLASAVIKTGNIDLAVKACTQLHAFLGTSSAESMLVRCICDSGSVPHIVEGIRKSIAESQMTFVQALLPLTDKAQLMDVFYENSDESGLNEDAALIMVEHLCTCDDSINEIEILELLEECTVAELPQAASRLRVEIGIREVRTKMV